MPPMQKAWVALFSEEAFLCRIFLFIVQFQKKEAVEKGKQAGVMCFRGFAAAIIGRDEDSALFRYV